MIELRCIKNLKKLNILIYQQGLGGVFLTNLFNLADGSMHNNTAMIKRMQQSVQTEFDHEITPVLRTRSTFFIGLHADCRDDQIDLWLTDIEISMLSEHLIWMDQYHRWVSDPSTVITQDTVYVPAHTPHVLPASMSLNHIADYASTLGISLRFIVATVSDPNIMAWAHRRQQIMLEDIPFKTWEWRQYNAYHEAASSSHAVELKLDAYLNGDVDQLIADMKLLLLNKMEDELVIRQRAQDFLDRKRNSA